MLGLVVGKVEVSKLIGWLQEWMTVVGASIPVVRHLEERQWLDATLDTGTDGEGAFIALDCASAYERERERERDRSV